jgi:hypothetical protein
VLKSLVSVAQLVEPWIVIPVVVGSIPIAHPNAKIQTLAAEKVMSKKAEDFFHCPVDNFNCAQSILKEFQEKFAISDVMITEYKRYGSGRADDNMCGALFSAIKLVEKMFPEKKEFIEMEFAKVAGSTKCKEITKSKEFTCKNCLRLASELLNEAMK